MAGIWSVSPGASASSARWAELLERKRQADVTVYATPLYVYTVTGLAETFRIHCSSPGNELAGGMLCGAGTIVLPRLFLPDCRLITGWDHVGVRRYGFMPENGRQKSLR